MFRWIKLIFIWLRLCSVCILLPLQPYIGILVKNPHYFVDSFDLFYPCSLVIHFILELIDTKHKTFILILYVSNSFIIILALLNVLFFNIIFNSITCNMPIYYWEIKPNSSFNSIFFHCNFISKILSYIIFILFGSTSIIITLPSIENWILPTQKFQFTKTMK